MEADGQDLRPEPLEERRKGLDKSYPSKNLVIFGGFLIPSPLMVWDELMGAQPGFFDVDHRMKRLSDLVTSLRRLGRQSISRYFAADRLALAYSDNGQGGRPPFDPVMMFKILVIQAANNLSDERTEFLINDRLSFMRFLGLGLSDLVPDARTIWLFREKLTKAEAIKTLFARFDASQPPVISPCPGRLSTPALSLRRASATLRRRRERSRRAASPRIGRTNPPS